MDFCGLLSGFLGRKVFRGEGEIARRTEMGRRLLVLYGSQTGCAEEVAEHVAREGARRHLEVVLRGMDEYDVKMLPSEEMAVCVSTNPRDPLDFPGRRSLILPHHPDIRLLHHRSRRPPGQYEALLELFAAKVASPRLSQHLLICRVWNGRQRVSWCPATIEPSSQRCNFQGAGTASFVFLEC